VRCRRAARDVAGPFRRPTTPGARRPTVILVVLSLVLLAACDREKRRFSESPPSATAYSAVALSELQPGVKTPDPTANSPYGQNAYAVSQGQYLYEQWNCVGCHSHGGGGMGPPLMDDEWIYGSEPENIVATIVEGRPNGMPSFRGRISNPQLWQIAAYVRSMSGLEPKTARPGRSDHMRGKEDEQSRSPEAPKKAQSRQPPAAALTP